MGYRIRHFDTESKFCQHLSLEALERVVPLCTIQAIVQQHGPQRTRERKLNPTATVLVVIAMHLFSFCCLEQVLHKIAQGLRFVWSDPDIALPNPSALSYRRYQLGAKPVVALFHEVCVPFATEHTPAAFLFGLRLMAIDATIEDVPDTPENARAFGRSEGGRGQSGFPQVQGVYLCECGTHAIVDAGFWPVHTSERVGGFRVLRWVRAGMLVMWDRGFHDFEMVRQVRKRKAHVLGRIPAQVQPQILRRLGDGSYLGWLLPSDYKRRKAGERILVRLIAYTFTDPALPGYEIVHRLITTLLDPEQAPASELACAYHERWEVEITIDEVDTHLRLVGRPLRSLKPVGVIQELYGVLIAHYAVRFLMHEAALEAGIDPDRLSYVHAVRVLQGALVEFAMVAPDQRDALYTRLLRDIARVRLPKRRPRCNPRVVKRKMSKFHLKRPADGPSPQPKRPFRESIALI